MPRVTNRANRPPPKKSGAKKKKFGPKKRHKDKDMHKIREAKVSNTKDFVGNIPCYKQLSHSFHDEKAAIEHLGNLGVINWFTNCQHLTATVNSEWDNHRFRCRECECQAPTHCEMCKHPMLKPEPDKDLNDPIRTCSEATCCWKWKPGKMVCCSFFHGSLLQNAPVPKNTILHCLCLWLLRVPARTAGMMLNWTEATVRRWHGHCRQMTLEMLLQRGKCASQISGEGVIVEIDESKFAKRKCNRGQMVKGDWVLGMVERTTQHRMALVVVPDQTAATLEAIIGRFTAPGSIAHSDMWKGHDTLNQMPTKNYVHGRLCHKCEFFSEDGVHTQTIEGNWSAIKKTIPI